MQNSILFPVLVETGGYIMHLDTRPVEEKVDSAVKPESESETKTEPKAITVEHAQEIIDTVKTRLEENNE